MGRLADLDAVTLDAYGTLLQLVDPIPKLRALLPEHSPETIEAAFRAEAEYYVEHSVQGRDEASLARLWASCTDVFNGAAGSTLTAAQYNGVFEFEVLPRVQQAIAALRARGLPLAVISNWDCSLGERLSELGIAHFFDFILSSAEAGVAKPDRRIFELALERLGVQPERALHVGDQPADEEGARAAGMHFAPAPLTDALAAWA